MFVDGAELVTATCERRSGARGHVIGGAPELRLREGGVDRRADPRPWFTRQRGTERDAVYRPGRGVEHGR